MRVRHQRNEFHGILGWSCDAHNCDARKAGYATAMLEYAVVMNPWVLSSRETERLLTRRTVIRRSRSDATWCAGRKILQREKESDKWPRHA